ncbi:hypothetical protein E6P09_13445 [Haloferax mediterranei ATCC 33500]|uniref:Uncharacterized protein n=1 Tax=Haloferax mediterranei (strain ATCC 33500 / DSM 1411 / JCM 8866 / NBRC 14739 / NCIMB 2177 / R-4) TaxID=523841 RepID=I3R7Y2_HALMT|nr:hypothetical protein [Haloferax mediterranei]AFK20342.1 hypothetical protein HFX_2664 [Haloferax mediterranei ATCC 33500]AHZ23710.1 hypothetical protein BM92_14135 [Haloferax mediterranei ATCC 33500]ELZ99198.1 hypothetical protein C439_15104 [Haloferax mediterranei ATCC 33500]MDX5986902.1 hypothetical protein [Haloferax mediterranei ATCC 33500]QCQ76224.1 hypothetical protein E6P09_13445 [Haloferax mediterranei ATCC 33500]
MSSDTTSGGDTASRSDTYVHRPGESDVGGSEPEAKGFGSRGWILVGVVALCFLVVPGAVYLVPSLPAMAGLPYITAMLALPMLPALLLGLVAVWSMTAATRGGD